jgi:L-asparagine transporter-like permease
MLFCTVHALGELAVAFPIAGAFSVYSSRFIDPAWGFAMGKSQVHPFVLNRQGAGLQSHFFRALACRAFVQSR